MWDMPRVVTWFIGSRVKWQDVDENVWTVNEKNKTNIHTNYKIFRFLISIICYIFRLSGSVVISARANQLVAKLIFWHDY